MTRNKTLIIIPAYNEEGSIKAVVDQIINDYPLYEYVIINDCSTDGTEQICKEKGYLYVSLPVNLGIGGAVQCGYRYALENGFDIAVQLDGDGQHNPAHIEFLLQPIIRGEADMVIGSRFINSEGFQSSAIRQFGIAIIRIVIRLCCGVRVLDTTSGFRAVNERMIKLFAEEYAHDYPEPEAIVSAVLNGFKIAEVPVVMNERTRGKSSINALQSAYYMLKVPLALLIYRLSVQKAKDKEHTRDE